MRTKKIKISEVETQPNYAATLRSFRQDEVRYLELVGTGYNALIVARSRLVPYGYRFEVKCFDNNAVYEIKCTLRPINS